MRSTSDEGDFAASVRALFPAGVLAATAPVDAEPRFAHALERLAVEQAVAKRRREFATGRRLAHGLLGELGFPDAPLLPGTDRAPLWPRGAVGSIAHTARRVVVAVGRSAEFRALGVDVEVALPLDGRLWESVLRPSERERLGAPTAASELLAMQHFCAKECLYKLLAARMNRMLEFDEVDVSLAPVRGEFTARVFAEELVLDAERAVTGRVLVRDDWIVTAAALPAAR